MNPSFHELMVHMLQDMYDAEKQALKALPKMAKAATSTKLKKGFEKHEKQTEKQIERLEKIAEKLGHKVKGVPCVGMEGLVKEGEEIMKMKLDPEVKDAALIVAAQKVEHYEIVAYASMITHAEMMGHKDAVKLMKESLDEEKRTDEELNKLAEGDLNKKAIKE
ncbi:MAG TPA: ferritin-like domain-containing protein [Candidatus Nitrosocosmicus sp.]|nr:ferritin-like domain-containing protein [Candidatus Nitrosocosmicus sp.]